MNYSLPTVSYIIPCYNQSKYLIDALNSITMSYSGPKEIIIINDYSSDLLTSKRLNELEHLFSDISIINNPKNLGLSKTRNIGISKSTGTYIQLLDSDDLLLPDKINYQIIQLENGFSLDISVTDYFDCDETLSFFTRPESKIGSFSLQLDDFLYKWERGLSIPIHSALFRRTVFDNCQFDETLRGKEDWYFWCNIAYQRKKIAYLNIDGAVYRHHDEGMTKRNFDEMAQMWKNAAQKINALFPESNEHFLAVSDEWYKKFYSVKNFPLQKIKENETKNVSQNMECIPSISIEKKDTYSNENILVSIIIPIYNHYDYLKKCIETACNQKVTNYEVICVDDQSSDPRVRLLLERIDLLKKSNIRVIFLDENQGISAAINQGIREAKGEYIGFLDCDDFLAGNSLEEIFINIDRYPNVDYFFSDRYDIDEKDALIREAKYGGYPNIHPTTDSNICNDLLFGMIASHFKVIRKSVIEKVNGLDSNLDGVQDWDLALKISQFGIFHYISKPLYYHRQHTNSVTISNQVSQFHKTNIVRRRNYCLQFRNGIEYEEVIEKIRLELSQGRLIPKEEFLNIRYFSPENIDLKSIETAFRQGFLLIFDMGWNIDQNCINFIREYNSFFDLILVRESINMIPILSYLWNTKILCFINKSIRYSCTLTKVLNK